MSREHLVLFSGGVGSFYTALRVKEANKGTQGLYLLFTDTLTEDSDLYRFLIETAAVVYDIPQRFIAELVDEARAIPPLEEALKGDEESGYYIDETIEELRRQKIKALADKTNGYIPDMLWVYEGRDIYQIFTKVRRLGNNFADPCSKFLKRQYSRNYLLENFNPNNTIVYLGYDFTEEHRYERSKPFWDEIGFTLACPLTERPYLNKIQMLEGLRLYGIAPPDLYVKGFAHNNCSGGCVKGGQGHWALLYDQYPRRFMYFALKEAGISRYLGKLVTMLTRQDFGSTILYPLTHLKADLQAGKAIDRFDIGGCGCFMPGIEETEED